MTFLLRLYPRAWRRRYGDEVREMLAGRGFSLRVAVDLVAGAIDTWLHPSATLAAAAAASPASEERTMLSRLLRLDCAFQGSGVTKEDQWKASVATVVWTLGLTLAWMAIHIRLGDDPRVDSLSLLPFMFALVYSTRYTYLKGRPRSVQAVFIGGTTLVVAVILLAAGWVAALI